MDLVAGKIIWDGARIRDRARTRIENPGLARFRGRWYCAVQESPTHNPHPLGRARLIRSADGEAWETVRTFEWDGGSVSVGLSVTAEGRLMAAGGVYFVSREPRPDLAPPRPRAGPGAADPNPMAHEGFRHYQLEPLGTVLNLPDNDRERNIAHQFVTWMSPDGDNWSGACASPALVNTEPYFRVTWHDGMGYLVGQWGKDPAGTLYRTRDGRDWRVLKASFGPGGRCNEGALAFAPDGTAWCLFRDGLELAMLGVGRPPYYQDWAWQPLLVDYGPEHGGPRPAKEVLGTSLGGPALLRLADGRLVGAGRALGPGRDDGRATLFHLDPDRGVLSVFAEMDGTSYPAVVEHDGALWVAFIGSAWRRGTWEVRLARVRF